MPIAARRHPLIAEVGKAMRSRCGFALDGPLVIGVSGGADSLALLIACCVLRGREDAPHRFEPIAVHVNHHLRDTAENDALHVKSICQRLGVKCEVVDVHPRDLPGNVSANAREMRYDATINAAKSIGASHIAVAHHAEDQVETMLAALCRGTGIEGAAGMRWSRPLDETVNLVRPLLGSTKADCESLCHAAEIQWREDPTNADVSFARARLRRDVLPVLEELWPGAAQRAGATAELLAIAAGAMEERLQQVFGDASQREWGRHDLAQHPAALLASGLRRAAIGCDASRDEDLPARQLFAAADAIRDDEKKPRTFALSKSAAVEITSLSVRLDPVAQAFRP